MTEHLRYFLLISHYFSVGEVVSVVQQNLTGSLMSRLLMCIRGTRLPSSGRFFTYRFNVRSCCCCCLRFVVVAFVDTPAPFHSCGLLNEK